VDFYCSAAKLIVELDGGQHSEERNLAYDEARTRWLATNGYRVLRFTNVEFLADPDRLMESIWRTVKEPIPSPNR
jgi:very-short-patch-repair endonuclease